MSAHTKTVKPILLGIACLVLLASCKKDADIPPELRTSDFWVHCSVADINGLVRPFEFRGDDQITIDSFWGSESYAFDVGYECSYGITAGQTKYINSSITDGFVSSLFNLTLRHPQKVENPLLPPEWKKSELEEVLVPGAVFPLGNAPGQADMSIRFFEDTVFHKTYPINNGMLQLLEVEDYGSPEANIPYFGKKARFRFSGEFYNGVDMWQVTDGEAVLFFRYFNY